MDRNNVFGYLLGAVVVLGFYAILGFLIVKRPEMVQVINLTIGALIGAFLTVVAYYYGSSKGSSDKNRMFELSKFSRSNTPSQLEQINSLKEKLKTLSLGSKEWEEVKLQIKVLESQ